MQLALLAKNKVGFIDGTLKQPAAFRTKLNLVGGQCSHGGHMDYEHHRKRLTIYYFVQQYRQESLGRTQAAIRHWCKCRMTETLLQQRNDARAREFLMGLDSSFAVIRSQILGMELLPSINRVYNMLIQEEGHIAKNCFLVTGRFSPWWGNRSREQIIWPPPGSDSDNRSSGTAASSSRRQLARALVATGGASSSGGGGSLNDGDRLDLNNLSKTEWDELTHLWNNHKSHHQVADRFNGNVSKHSWIIDTGASHHMSGSLDNFTNIVTIPSSLVGMPNSELLMATKRGDIVLGHNLFLKNALFSPNLHCNLISISSLLLDGTLSIQFTHKLCVILDRALKLMIGAGEQREGLYYLCGVCNSGARIFSAKACDTEELWHCRLGHPSAKITGSLSVISRNNGSCFESKTCDVCLRAKQSRDSFHLSDNKATHIFDLIHCDLWGRYSANGACGSRYFLTIVDNQSRSVWVHLLRDKSEEEYLNYKV
ncbi:uncharacterized protein LOC141637678 [Silene latifolia]|uniref:uncharacterized protein LOC141637678 n=1 Tax=Silene latifolia TaxID=37657 RepID=UPI003D76B4D4